MLRFRVFTAVVLAPPVVAGVWLLPGPVFALLAGLVFLLAGWEWTRLAGIEGGANQALYLVAMALAMAALEWNGLVPLAPIVALVGVAWWCAAAIWLCCYGFGERGGRLAGALKALAGLLALVPAWTVLSALQSVPGGPPWVLMLLAVVWAADICAYFVGRRFGRRRLAPRISPGKTWAGVGGALGGALVVGAGGGLLLGLEAGPQLALVGVILATVAFSVIGDLFESLVKRHAGAKDSGALLPGHGGVFDRLDSLFAAAPVFYWGFEWLQP